MRSKILAFVFLTLITIIFVSECVQQEEKLVSNYTSIPQGFSPFAIAITKDGTYAYVGFDLSEDVFKIRLADFTIQATANLSNYFPLESEHIVLDASEKKLFVNSATWQKLLVLDVQNMSVIHTINNVNVNDMFLSQYGPFLIALDGGIVKFINTETYEMTNFTDERIGFWRIRESKYDQNKWYVVTQEGPDGPTVVGAYNYKTKAWINKVSFPLQVEGEWTPDFKILPNEQKAYLAAFGGWYPEYHSYGWFYSIDLNEWKVKAVPVDGGALSLEASPDNQRLYVGTGWPMPNENNILVIDTQSDNVIGQIYLGHTKYNWHYTQINVLQIDPANPNLLYATCTDGNAFIKANLTNLSLADVIILNQESFQPHFFVKQPKQATGYVLIQGANAFELDLNNADIKNVVKFPSIRIDAGSYDIAISDSGRLLITQGESILEVDQQNMRLIETHQLPPTVPPVWNFILSRDQKMLYSTSQERGKPEYQPNIFLAINASNFEVEAQFKLEGGGFERPYEPPDGSKIYVLGGMQNGPVVIQVINKDNYTIQKTITFNESDSLGFATSPNYAYAYDSGTHTLFVGATWVVLAIDTDTDIIKKVIYLNDAAKAIGFGSTPWQLTSINAIALVYNPEENYLYIAHLDRSFVSIYDLNNDRFLPLVIPLKGYFPSYIFANDDYSKIYSLNIRSDSVSVIDVESKAIEKVIDLHTVRI
jgi:DNA-binding beta-propeller fold protein YncE